jgi:serine/threonine protein kinase
MANTDDLRWLSDDERVRLSGCLSDFQQAWQTAVDCGQEVNLKPYLPPPGDRLRRVALQRLIATDLAERWRSGQHVTLEQYLRDYPELGTPADLPAPLILEEYRARKEHGPPPDLGEYQDRFPEQFSRLHRLIEQESPAAPPPPVPPAPAPPAGSVDLQAGAIVGAGYRLIRRLGRGAFGEVWQAEAPGGVPVAVKVIFRSLTEREAQTERQALELTKTLAHVFLLQTHSFWAMDDRLLIVMELAHGSLRDRFKECQAQGLTGIPVGELLPYIEQSAAALDYLHDNQRLHRDIKPENILRVGKNAKVADFGLAMVLPETVRSVTVNAAGTIPYMGPEVWYGKACKASDQWSLAITYVELRAGRVLFSGSNQAEIMFAILNSPPDLSGLEPAEQDVLRIALAKEHANRFATCSEFAEALRLALASVLPAKKASGVRPTVRSNRRSTVEAPAPVPPPPYAPSEGGGYAEMQTQPDPLSGGGRAGAEPPPGLQHTILSATGETESSDKGFKTLPPPSQKKEPPPWQSDDPPNATARPTPRPTQAQVPRARRLGERPTTSGSPVVALLAVLVAVAGLVGWVVYLMFIKTPATDSTGQVAVATSVSTPATGGGEKGNEKSSEKGSKKSSEKSSEKGNGGAAATSTGKTTPVSAPKKPHEMSLDELLAALKPSAGEPQPDLPALLGEVANKLDGLAPDDAAKAEAAADRLKEARLPAALSAYATYAQAVAKEKKNRPQEAADAYVAAFEKKALPAGLATDKRAKRVADFLLSAARGQRSREPFAFDRPFDSGAEAGRASGWLGAAETLWTDHGTAPAALPVNQALAAWYRADPGPDGKRHPPPADVGQVVRWTASLLPPRDPKDWDGVDLAALWIVRAAALAEEKATNSRAAFDAYLAARAAVRALPPDTGDRRALAVVTAILEPAVAVGSGLARGPDREFNVQYAQLCAEEADLVRTHPSAEWPWPKEARPRKLFDLYNAAVRNDGSKAEYYAWRGTARIDLPATDGESKLESIRVDANEAKRKNKEYPRGHFLSGYANHQDSRRQARPEKRLELLKKAIEDYTTALDLPKYKDDDSRPTVLTNRSAAYLELGNATPNPKERADYLKKAQQDAADAEANHTRPEEAAEARGNALEDIAWLVETDTQKKREKYNEAVLAFGLGVNNQPENPAFLLDRARVRVRWAKDVKADAEDLLPKARDDLKGVLSLKAATPLDRAKAHDELALVALLEGDRDGAAKEFDEAAQLIDPASPPPALYAFGWASAVKSEAAGDNKNVATLAPAVRERMRRLKPDAPAWRVARALMLGWSHEVENNPQAALKEYDAVLPNNLGLATTDDLPVLIARGRLQLTYLQALKPSLRDVCDQADRAVQLAEDPEVSVTTRAEASAHQGYAWDARLSEALDRKAPLAEAVQAARKSVAGFESAVKWQPDSRPALGWRYQLACNIDYVAARDEGVRGDKKCDMVKAAREHLRKARAMTRKEDESWRKAIDKELAQQQQAFADCLDE